MANTCYLLARVTTAIITKVRRRKTMCDYLAFEESGLIAGTPEYEKIHKKYKDRKHPAISIVLNPITGMPYESITRRMVKDGDIYVR